jgi:hypothetical protein
MVEFPDAQSPVPIADPRCIPVADPFALTLEFQIVKVPSREVPTEIPPVPIPAPVHVVNATTTAFMIVRFSITEDPEETFPPPRAAPLVAAVPDPLDKAVALTIAP